MPEIQIDTDGITVWVNTPTYCIGRFGVQGIDIHHSPGDGALAGNECLFCTHEKTEAKDWPVFVQKMKELHGVTVSRRYCPDRFRGVPALV